MMMMMIWVMMVGWGSLYNVTLIAAQDWAAPDHTTRWHLLSIEDKDKDKDTLPVGTS